MGRSKAGNIGGSFRTPIIVSIFFSIAATSRSELIYEQLPGTLTPTISSTLDNFGRLPGFRTADDFTLAFKSTIVGVDWWGKSNSGGDDFRFSFYSDGGGLPGDMLLTTGGTLIKETVNLGFFLDPVNYYTSILDTEFNAAANTTYWLSIFNQASNSSWRWVSAMTTGNGSRQGQNPGPPWSIHAADRSFQLVGVPEPSVLSFALIGLALAWRFRLR